MNLPVSRVLTLLAFVLATSASAKLTPEQVKSLPPPANHPVNFTTEVKPIFEASCIKCHGRGKDKGGFRIDNREAILSKSDSGPAVIPGHSVDSYLIELVAGIDPDSMMPKKGSKLSPQQVGVLRAWIDQGAVWDAGVTFAKPEPVNLQPAVVALPKGGSAKDNPVDRLLAPYFKANKVKAGKPVDDRAYARRVYLDVIGLLPPADELEKFVADQSRDKRRQLVQRLLADNQNYALNWLTFWNDLLRNDYKGTGYIDGGRKQISAWLYAALAENKPYDQFVAELINPVPESEGFVKGIVWRGVVNASQTPQMQAAQNISQVFMGVNLKCASCHDSFINDWSLADAYGLASIYADAPLELVHCDKPTGKIASLKFIYPELGAIDAATNREARLKQLAEVVTGKKDGRLSRTIVNRLWAKFMGYGLVEPLDDMEQPAWNPALLDWLAEDLVNNGYNLKVTMERILTSEAYQMPSVDLDEQKHKDYVFRGPAVRRLTAEQFRDALGSLTGVWYAKSSLPVKGQTGPVRAALVPADPLMVALGRPNREQVITRRASAATTLEAIELTNGGTLDHILKTGAEKLTAKNSASANAFVATIFEAGLSRRPTAKELKLAEGMVGSPVKKEGVEDLLWSLAMLPEFQLIY